MTVPRECKEDILAFLDGQADRLDLHPVVQGGALVEVFSRKGTDDALARYFDYADYAAGKEYPLRELSPDRAAALDAFAKAPAGK